MSTPSNLYTVQVTKRGASRLRGGHPWVYRSDLGRYPSALPGGVVRVEDERGKFLAFALYSSSSQIAIRAIGSELTVDLSALVRERIRAAVAYRRAIVRNADSYRVVFSEADLLPGLIVDRYNDIVSFQILTQALDPEQIRQTIVETLASELNPATIVERTDVRIRELEALPPRETTIVWSNVPEGQPLPPKTRTEFTLNGIRFEYDALAGQKTGAFLDQRENYAATERYARGRALDICTYQGGFALHLNRRCESVTAVDISRDALETADRNLSLNVDQYSGRDIEWIEANAFELLKDYSSSGRQYDTIVLDPPAFAKGKGQVESALRGYKELNLRALKMLRPGGTLVTCSCSYHVVEPEFVDIVSAAALDARRAVRVLEKRAQSQDHPILLNVPETHYLKCLILSVA